MKKILVFLCLLAIAIPTFAYARGSGHGGQRGDTIATATMGTQGITVPLVPARVIGVSSAVAKRARNLCGRPAIPMAGPAM
jgi:hypothetical protein